MMSQLDSKAPKAPYNKIINPSKVRENYRLRLRKDKLAAVQREKRLQSYKNKFPTSSSYKINLSDVEIAIDASFISSYRSNQHPAEFILSYIDSFVSSPNNQNINYLKFCLANLYLMTSTLKKNNEEIEQSIGQLFTKTRCSNLVTLMCFPQIEICIPYELSLIINSLICFSSTLSLFISCQENISRIFNQLVSCTTNYPMAESILHLMNNLMYEKECLQLIIANTSIDTYVLGSIPMMTADIPLSFINILFTTLGNIITEDVVVSKRKDFMSILPIIKKYVSTDIDSSLFVEVLNCLCSFLQKLEKEDCDNGKANELFNAEFEVLLDKYVETNAEPIILEKIFNIYWSLTYLNDSFIDNMCTNSHIFDKISNLLDYIVGNPHSNPYLSDVLYSLLNFIFNVFTSNKNKRYIIRKTKIIQDIILILINNLVESNLISLILETLLELVKNKDSTIITFLICIDFPKIVIVSQLNNETLSGQSQFIVLKMLDIMLEYGERILSDKSNLLMNTFDQLGIGMIVEKMTVSKINIVSEEAEKIYKTYFKTDN